MNFQRFIVLLARSRIHFPFSRLIFNGRNVKQLSKREELWTDHCRNIRSPNVFQYFVTQRSSHTVSNEEFKNKYNPIEYHPPQFADVVFDEPVPHEQLIAALKECHSIEEQMRTLCTTLELDKKEIERRTEFCETIGSMLRPFLPGISIHMFGSSVNGYGFKGCDVDMSFRITPEPKIDKYYLEQPNVPLVGEVLSGRVSPAEILQLPPREKLIFIHTVFLEFYRESNFGPIFINCNVPIVRFHHDKYNLKCDLSHENHVAISNTNLLLLFGKLDERVMLMMMTIRYWAKHVELIGKGLLFNTYTISLLVIFFFQNCNPPILPSTEHILSVTDCLDKDEMNDQTVLDIIRRIPPSKNKQSLEQLLKDFFLFYLYFDFTRVICPLTATAVPREEFFSDEKNKKFKMNSICVQDPMCVSHNVAEIVHFKNCKQLTLHCIAACRLFQDSANFLNAKNDVWGLLTLLGNSEELNSLSSHFKDGIMFEIPIISKQLSKNPANLNNKDLLKTAQTVLEILEHALLIKHKCVQYSDALDLLTKLDASLARRKKIVAIVEDTHSSKFEHLTVRQNKRNMSIKESENDSIQYTVKHSDDFKNLNDNNDLILCAECKTTHNTWHGRWHIKKELPSNFYMNVLELEKSISMKLVEQNSNLPELYYQKNDEKSSKSFQFLCEFYSNKDNVSSLLVKLRSLHGSVFNPILGIFLKEFIPKVLVKLENEGR